MADAKISELAEVVGVSVDKLLSQIKEAGLSHIKADDSISNDDKNTLLQFLRRSHGDSEASISAPKKITLKRKTVGTLKAASTHGRGKTVNVEVRKKRTYVKRSAVVEDAPEELEDEAVVAAAKSAEEAAIDNNVEVKFMPLPALGSNYCTEIWAQSPAILDQKCLPKNLFSRDRQARCEAQGTGQERL